MSIQALPQLLRFMIEIISGVALPWSIKRPTRSAPCSPSAISVCMSASFFWYSWVPAKGLPNCLRSSPYCQAGRVPWVQPWGTAAAKALLAMPKNGAYRPGPTQGSTC
jgi:hypothetical protein